MNHLRIISVFCSFLSLLLLLLSLGSNYWVVSGSVHVGLWNVCVSSVCSSLGMEVGGGDHVTRAFMMLGMVAGAVSFFGLCVTFFKSEIGSMSLTKISAEASFFAALFAVIAMATFTASSSALSPVYGWSFILGWTSFPLFFCTGFMTYSLQRNLPREKGSSNFSGGSGNVGGQGVPPYPVQSDPY